MISRTEGGPYRFLDIGCGEGWALRFFKEKSWSVTGLDYSDFGCKTHNPECAENLFVGDIYHNLQSFLGKRNFHCILLDNVLEHVLDPLQLVEHCKELLEDDGVLVIEVPNDFSKVQQILYEQNRISKVFWVVGPDHISYFNREGLINLTAEAGLQTKHMIGDYPIDFNLFNDNINYINDSSKGKSCHQERLQSKICSPRFPSRKQSSCTPR